MKVHEYQARQLLHDAGIAVPPGAMVETVDDAAREAKRIFDRAPASQSSRLRCTRAVAARRAS